MPHSLPELCRTWLDLEHSRHSIAKHGHTQQADFLRGDYWDASNFGGFALSYYSRRKLFQGDDPDVLAHRAQLSGKITSTFDALYAGILSLDGLDIPTCFQHATVFVQEHLARITDTPEATDPTLWNGVEAGLDQLAEELPQGNRESFKQLGGVILGQAAQLMYQDFQRCLVTPAGYLPKPSLTSGNLEPWDIIGS